MIFISGTQSLVCECQARFRAGSHVGQTGGGGGRSGQGFQSPSCGLAAEEAGPVSPRLPQPEDKVCVCRLHPGFLLPQPNSTKCPPLPPLWNGEVGRGKLPKLETGGWGNGGGGESGYFQSLWLCGQGQGQLRSCVLLSLSSSTHPIPQDVETETGGRPCLSSLAGEPRKHLEAMPHLTERNAEAWGGGGRSTGHRAKATAPAF